MVACLSLSVQYRLCSINFWCVGFLSQLRITTPGYIFTGKLPLIMLYIVYIFVIHKYVVKTVFISYLSHTLLRGGGLKSRVGSYHDTGLVKDNMSVKSIMPQDKHCGAVCLIKEKCIIYEIIKPPYQPDQVNSSCKY